MTPEQTSTSTFRRPPVWLRALLWLATALVLLAVFGLYLEPDFMLTMADQVWACF